MYNMTQLRAVDSFIDLVTYANDSTGGILVGLFMIAFFFIMLMVLKKWDFASALLSSSFVTFVIMAVMSFAGLLNLYFPLAFLAITAFTAMFVYVGRK